MKPRKAMSIAAVLTLLGADVGCSQILGLDAEPTIGGSGGTTSGTGGGDAGCNKTVKDGPLKVDLLLAIDNSRSMADKQEILALAIPDIIARLSNPLCLDDTGKPANPQPPTGFADCPPGSERQLQASQDIHIGVITSSLGGHGSDACATTAPGNPSNDDRGHLITRKDPSSADVVQTYQDQGFLAWDPLQQLEPPGESSPAAIQQDLRDLVQGAGERGCGFEAQLESWYRFLIDPMPYDVLAKEDPNVIGSPTTLQGVDMALLDQRKSFLRPDSLLIILMLSDENDCSIRDGGPYYLAAQNKGPNGNQFLLPKPRAECAINPDDECCNACGLMVPEACGEDPSCLDPNGMPAHLDIADDSLGLRCWDQKRRFGIDFLYPIDRYTTGLTNPMVPDRSGELVPNPIYSNLGPDPEAEVRGCNLVMLGGIVGVPWQDIARVTSDLSFGFMDAKELHDPGDTVSRWEVILGDPAAHTPPLDPHMIESTEPRKGTNPITGDTLSPPAQQVDGPDSISGHEYTSNNQDLQYACIFPVTPRDCTDPMQTSCDCQDIANDSPLCDVDEVTGDRTKQVRAKVYPSLRQLRVLRDAGPQGVVASICPAQYQDDTRADYAYRPAIEAILHQAASQLREPAGQ